MKELIQRLYSVIEVLPIIKKVELIDKYKFAKIVLNKHFNSFVIYAAAVNISMTIYPD